MKSTVVLYFIIAKEKCLIQTDTREIHLCYNTYMKNYTYRNVTLKEPLSFWSAFPVADQRFFWFDPIEQNIVMGCEKMETIDEKDISNAPFAFYTQPFFDQIKGKTWGSITKELVTFKHYYTVDLNNKEKNKLYSIALETLPTIVDQEIPEFHPHLKLLEKDKSEWEHLFQDIQDALSTQKIEKIVASQRITLKNLSGHFQFEGILKRLMKNNPQAFVFAYQKGDFVFCGASPEILVKKQGQKIMSYALAGTMSKGIKNASQLLLNDSKNRLEHQIVVKSIKEKMLKVSDEVNVSKIETVALKNVYHLRTQLSLIDKKASLIAWAKMLHPTPALGGFPQKDALNFLKIHEKHERGLYAAPCGLVKQNGDGTIIVGIRSALFTSEYLYAFAGCGIVSESDCHSEYEEIKLKLQTILEAL